MKASSSSPSSAVIVLVVKSKQEKKSEKEKAVKDGNEMEAEGERREGGVEMQTSNN